MTRPPPRVLSARPALPGSFALQALLFLCACDGVPGLQDEADLTARGASPPPLDCAACHPYPPGDINHYYHLTLQPESAPRGAAHLATCLDCHARSLLHFDYVLDDGSRRLRPLPAGLPADTARSEALAARVDSLIRAYAETKRQVAWRTGPSHLDGTVDVALSPSMVTDTLRGYDPSDLSCSAVACHKQPAAKYRWRSPGFTDCPSRTGHDTTCGEPPENP